MSMATFNTATLAQNNQSDHVMVAGQNAVDPLRTGFIRSSYGSFTPGFAGAAQVDAFEWVQGISGALRNLGIDLGSTVAKQWDRVTIVGTNWNEDLAWEDGTLVGTNLIINLPLRAIGFSVGASYDIQFQGLRI